jgi:hypothetical protein
MPPATLRIEADAALFAGVQALSRRFHKRQRGPWGDRSSRDARTRLAGRDP